MRRRTIQLRSGTWEWRVVDPDDPRTRRRARGAHARVRGAGDAGAERTGRGAVPGAQEEEEAEEPVAGAPPLPRRRIELRGPGDPRRRMCVGVPPHLGHAGDDAAVQMLALNPDQRVVVDPAGVTWALWPVHLETDAAPPSLAASRAVRALPQGGRPRTITLPEGLALGQLTDREILDLLA